MHRPIHLDAAWTDRIRRVLARDGVFPRFAYLLTTQAVVVLLGLGYWVTTTRTVRATSVGIAAAAVAAANLISALSTFGIGSLFLAELGRMTSASRRAILSTGMSVAGLGALVIAVGVWAAAGLVGGSMEEFAEYPSIAALFVAGTVMSAAAAVFDSAAIGMHRAPVQLARNAVNAAARISLVALAVVLGLRQADDLLLVWVLAMGVSLYLGWRRLGFQGAEERPTLSARGKLVRLYGRPALRHYALSVATKSAALFLPVLAAIFAEPGHFAAFSTAQLVATTILLAPAFLAMSLFVETSNDPTTLRRNVRRTAAVALAWCVLAVAVVEPLARTLLSPFGPQYAIQGSEYLRLLVIGGIPYVFKDHYVAIRRARGELASAAQVIALATAFEVTLSALGGAADGLKGLCVGWLVATLLEGATFAPLLFRLITARPAAGDRVHEHYERLPV